jgi:hypothetical protein
MNKRIEELAVSSGIYDSLCDPYDALKNGDYYSSIKVDLEKFAELIVQECIEQVEVFNVRMDARPRHIVEAIKSHFGVEE